MTDPPTPLQAGTDLNQAGRFHARERRRSLAGLVDLNRTHRIFGGTVMGVASIPVSTIFSADVRSAPVTFQTAIRITGASPVGLIFELGGSPRGCGVALSGKFLGFFAGLSNSTNGSFSLLDNGATFPIGLELDLVFAINPGKGKTIIWGNGRELARATASAGTLNGTWAGANDGSFAADFNSQIPLELTGAPLAPVDFEVIEPLSIYVGQVPQHFY